MAKIIKRTKKDGTCSYCIRVSNGYDRQGRQVLVNRTFTPPPGLTGKKLEKELQAAIYDAEDGSCLFGRVLYVNKSSMYKYDYVIDDHATEAFTACWDLSACWLNK